MSKKTVGDAEMAIQPFMSSVGQTIQTYLQSRNRLTDLENEFMVASRGRMWGRDSYGIGDG